MLRASLVLLSLAACGESHLLGELDGGRDARGVDAPGVDALGVDATRRDTGDGTAIVSAQIGPFVTPPGHEDTLCIVVDLGNESPAYIRSVRAHLDEGSHHMIVHRVDRGVADPVPSPCPAFAHAMSGTMIFIAQQPESALVYPEGSGLRVEPHQLIGLEMHFINYFSDRNEDIAGQVELELTTDDRPLEEVQFLFTGELALSLPPRERTTVTSFHAVPPGARIFALTSHTHQYGAVSYIERTRSVSDEGPILHESTSWAEPPLDVFEPPIRFAPGEGLKLTCEFVNTSDSYVGFGLDFDDEMCFLWVYYLR